MRKPCKIKKIRPEARFENQFYIICILKG